MRTLLMLLLVVLAFLAVRWFSPGPGTAAADAGQPAEVGVRFLPPPEAPLSEAPPRDAPGGADVTAALQGAVVVEESWPASLLESLPHGTADELRVAAALLHGTPAQVQEASVALDRDRALLLESFSWEMAGERQMALSLSEKIAREGVGEDERALFEAALTGRNVPASPTATGPVPRAMEMALMARGGRQALEAREFVEAARAFSDLLVAEISAPWPADPRVLADWTQSLDEAQREHRWNPRSSWPSTEITVERGDSLIAIRLRFLAANPDARMCTGILERANRLKGQLQPGQVLKVPTDPARVLVDLGARWALYFLGEEVAAAWPVGIGRPGEETPTGEFTVRNKLENPPWMKEGQEPIPFGDPRNPLGTRWIGWSREGAKTSYGFHGTWEPGSVGQAASDGCVRLLNEDVEELFQILPEGAPIRIQP